MLAIGFGLAWLGYCVGYYGWNRITGGNDTFKSLVWPGAYKPTTRDDGTGGGAAPAAASKPAAASSPPSAAFPAQQPAQYSPGAGGSGAIHP